jgi:hypothetical protein
MEDKFLIQDEAPKRKYYTQIPHMIDDADLSPHAVRLYIHLKRIAGDDGGCWQTTEDLAKSCHMSRPTVIRSKRELKVKGFIIIEDWSEHLRRRHKIRIVDIWRENEERYAPVEKAISRHKDGNNREVLEETQNLTLSCPAEQECSAEEILEESQKSTPSGSKIGTVGVKNKHCKNNPGTRKTKDKEESIGGFRGEQKLSPSEALEDSESQAQELAPSPAPGWLMILERLTPFRLSPEEISEIEAEFRGIDLEAEAKSFVLWWSEGRRKLKRPKSAWRNWLRKAGKIRAKNIRYPTRYTSPEELDRILDTEEGRRAIYGRFPQYPIRYTEPEELDRILDLEEKRRAQNAQFASRYTEPEEVD